MNLNFEAGAEKYAGWLLGHSAQAAVLVLLVFGVQWAFRRQLSNRWRFALWWLVLARLVLPFGPSSAMSLFNIFRPITAPTTVSMGAVHPVQVVHPSVHSLSDDMASGSLDSVPPAQGTSEMAMKTTLTPADPGSPTVISASSMRPEKPVTARAAWWRAADVAWRAGMGLWLLGVVGLSGGVMVQVFRFRRTLAAVGSSVDPGLVELWEECRREFGVSRRIELRETEAVSSPALSGLFRLRLLLPRGLGEQFTRRELRYIFLHELAHVKRGDLWLNWLITGLQILHWFNPVIWWGFARMRADRELACDELALLQAGDRTGETYGQTIIKLLEGLNRPAAIPGLVGILEDKKQMRRRITMIANFRQPGRWSKLAVLLIAAVAVVTLTDAQTEKPVGQNPSATTGDVGVESPAVTGPDLTGTVVAKDGTAIQATIFIATAGPKVGTSPFCPSCYADCRKSAKAEADGSFKISSLDPQLKFQVLAVAKGFKPKYVNGVDPAKGPIKVTLSPIELAAAAPENSLHGRVTDATGKPLAGAVIEAHGMRERNGQATWGQLSGFDPLAVADENGEFLITAKKPFYQMDVQVTARGFASGLFTELPSGNTVHSLTLTVGAAMKGRVMYQGRPLANISVGLSTVNGNPDHFSGHFDVGTDTNGQFLFLNLPPDTDYNISGSMDTLGKYGAIPVQPIHSGAEGETTDAGDLMVGTGYRVAGQVVLADGAPIPAKTRLLLDREGAWDSAQVILPPDGHFEFKGVSAGVVSISLRLSGYRVAAQNASFDMLNPFRLMGKVSGDVTGIQFLLEKGATLPADFSSQNGWRDLLVRTLHGAELKPDHAHEVVVTGRVTDSQTGEPLAHFEVIPGSMDGWGHTSWRRQDMVEGTNGIYQVFLQKKWTQPMLKVTAPGYLPGGVPLLAFEQTNADFALHQGSGPAGVILNPDGTPAAGADALLICAESENCGYTGDGHLRAWYNGELQVKADANGQFALPAELGMTGIVVASTNGFNAVSMASWATNQSISLKPYGAISGTLLRPVGAGTNEDLDLKLDDDAVGKDFHLENHVVTDGAGHFEFDQVPPGQLQICGRLKMDHALSWQTVPLQSVTVEAGQTLSLTIHEPARETIQQPSGGQLPPKAQAIPGSEIQGIVLSAEGKPVAEAQVALKVPGQGLFLNQAEITAGSQNLVQSTDFEGKFSLPMYAGAQTVYAVNEDGYAAVSVEDFKRSPRITLQPWGRVEGRLRVGHHPGVRQQVQLTDPPRFSHKTSASGSAADTNVVLQPDVPIFYNNSATTDDQGHFILSYIPPGEHAISLQVPTGNNSRQSQMLGKFQVKPGEVLHATFGGGERLVTGKLVFSSTNLPGNLGEAMVRFSGIEMARLSEKVRAASTQAERLAIYRSPEYQKAMAAQYAYNYPVSLQADGSFQAPAVPAGTYQITAFFMRQYEHATDMTYFLTPQNVVVPPFKDEQDDSTVDLGTIALAAKTIPSTK